MVADSSNAGLVIVHYFRLTLSYIVLGTLQWRLEVFHFQNRVYLYSATSVSFSLISPTVNPGHADHAAACPLSRSSMESWREGSAQSAQSAQSALLTRLQSTVSSQCETALR